MSPVNWRSPTKSTAAGSRNTRPFLTWMPTQMPSPFSISNWNTKVGSATLLPQSQLNSPRKQLLEEMMRTLTGREILHIWEVGQRQHPLDRAMTMLHVAFPEATRDELV